MTTNIKSKRIASEKLKFPVHGWFGFGLMIVFWILNWTLQARVRSGVSFRCGWVTAWRSMGWSIWRTGTSLLRRSPRKYIGLFLVSAPVWWIFELLNVRTQNWTYIGAEIFSPLEYAFWTTLSFTTVIPAVFGSAEFFASFDFIKRLQRGPVIGTDKRTTLIFFILGWIMLALMLIWPTDFLSLHLAIPLLHSGTDQYLAGESFPRPLDSKRGLASGDFAMAWRFADCVLLGNVELLFVPEVGLPCAVG